MPEPAPGEARTPLLSRTRIIYYTSFATDLAYFTFLFSLSRWLAETGASQWQLGVFGACGSLSYALSGPVAGMVSDRFGRRRVILCGSVATILALAAAAVWRSASIFPFLAIGCGIAVALVFPPLIAWLTADGRDSSRRLFRFCVSWNAGVLLGQMGAGWLYLLRPELPLLAVTIPMAAVVALLLVWKPEPPAPATVATEAGGPPSPGPRPEARAFAYMAWIANGAGALAFSLVTHLFPLLAHESGISPPVHGAMLALGRITVLISYFVLYRSPFWHYRIWPAVVAQAAAIAGLALLGFAGAAPLLALGLMLTSPMIGYNYFAGIYYSTEAFGANRRGAASGMHEASLAIGGGAGALGGGIIGSLYGTRAPYQLCALLLAALVVSQWAIHRAMDNSARERPRAAV
ncbi:MAG: MFS transporter [Acidobacteria bacterium]|nr:MFS transporter [Acidobacteriota bacterium]